MVNPVLPPFHQYFFIDFYCQQVRNVTTLEDWKLAPHERLAREGWKEQWAS